MHLFDGRHTHVSLSSEPLAERNERCWSAPKEKQHAPLPEMMQHAIQAHGVATAAGICMTTWYCTIMTLWGIQQTARACRCSLFNATTAIFLSETTAYGGKTGMLDSHAKHEREQKLLSLRRWLLHHFHKCAPCWLAGGIRSKKPSLLAGRANILQHGTDQIQRRCYQQVYLRQGPRCHMMPERM